MKMNRFYKKGKIAASVLLILSMIIVSRSVFAASITLITDTMSSTAISTASTHAISFTLPAGISFDSVSYLDVVEFDFPDSFTASGTWDTSDFSLDGGGATVAGVDTATYDFAVSCSNTTTNVGVDIDTVNMKFAVVPCGSSFTSGGAAGGTFVFTIYGTSGTGGGILTNPSAIAYYTINLNMKDENVVGAHTGPTIILLDSIEDYVDISATVDPVINFTISDTTCEIGALSTDAGDHTCSYNLVASTNASTGMAIYGQASNSTLTSGTDNIDAVTGLVSSGISDEGYGVYHSAITGTSPTLLNIGTLGDVLFETNASTNYGSIDTTIEMLFGSGAPVNPSTITVTHAADISGVTAAGSYSQTITYTAVGEF